TRPMSVEFQLRESALSGTGVQMRTEGSGNQNPRGITPITVRGRPSSVTYVPMMAGSPPSSCHKPKLSRATPSAPGTSSPSRNPRPSKGAAPSTSRSSDDAVTPGTRPADPLPSPDRLRILLHEGDIAELQQGLTARLFWRHSAIEVVARFALDVVADVVLERLQYPSAARHDVIPPARPGGGFAPRPPPACP